METALNEPSVVRNGRKMVDVFVTMPNHIVYSFQLPFNCKGQECLQMICDILGIVEIDYFGLKYPEKGTGWKIWLNNRQQVRHQVLTKPPYQLTFWVKYYTDINLILQPTTIDAFFITVKRQLKEGSMFLQDSQKGVFGALMAQAEIGDAQERASQAAGSEVAISQFGYPEYFPDWSLGIVKNIAAEHKKLKGLPPVEAKRRFLKLASDVFRYGIEMTKVVAVDGQKTMVGIGGGAVHIFDMQWNYIKRVPYNHLTTVLYGIDNFTIQFKARNGQHEIVEQKLKFIVPTTAIAKSLFRSTTENQTFFLHPTVNEDVRSHAHISSYTKCRLLAKRLFRLGTMVEPRYYFDIQRTKHEAYAYAWQRLHQVTQDQMNNVASTTRTDAPINANIQTEEVNNESSTLSCTTSTSTGVQAKSRMNLLWGLSQSSSDLAKELLPESQLQEMPSGEVLGTFVIDGGEQESKCKDAELVTADEKLTESQGKKLCQLLQKIHEQRTCRVCMDCPISAVFCPCGHHIACYDCALRVPRCPLCREEIGFVQYVYNCGC